MPQFFSLPRELRDMIYMEVITSQLPAPSLSSTAYASGWCRPWEPKSGLGNNGCAFSSRRAPNTCANFFACNRQINEEMAFAIERARRKGLLAARMDCIAKDEMHWFTWLAIPLVRTTLASKSASSSSSSSSTYSSSSSSSSSSSRSASQSKLRPDALVPNFLGKYLPHACPGTATSTSTTTIDQLLISIRLFASGKKGVEQARDRTSWAICAALKHVFEHDPDIIPTRDCRNDIHVGEVILDIIPTVPTAPQPVQNTPQAPSQGAEQEDGVSVEETLAKELVDVWNKLWSGDGFKARYYRGLLERIGRVKVCVEGKVYRVRELGDELERGKRERRRIEMRGGWWGGGEGDL
ncbi:hypothetical protein ACN47E_006875 [Coniothyrium glycines]